MIRTTSPKENKVYNFAIYSTAGKEIHRGKALYLGKVMGTRGNLHGVLYRDKSGHIELMKSGQVVKFAQQTRFLMTAAVRDYANLSGLELKGCEQMLQEVRL